MSPTKADMAAARGRRRTVAEDGPDAVDVHVGQRLRQRRTLLGMSQDKLAKAFGVTFQQVQKYERGANRISASRLHRLSSVLNVPLTYFFDGLPGSADGAAPEPSGDAQLARRETLELVRAYYAIGDSRVRRRLNDLVRVLGAPDPKEGPT